MSTICLPDVIAHDQISQAFSLIVAYCKQSNTGGGNGLGTRLISIDSQAKLMHDQVMTMQTYVRIVIVRSCLNYEFCWPAKEWNGHSNSV